LAAWALDTQAQLGYVLLRCVTVTTPPAINDDTKKLPKVSCKHAGKRWARNLSHVKCDGTRAFPRSSKI
jgi:hypothetical protein